MEETNDRKRGYDVIVVGAGAAGMMAAGTAARAGKSVLLLEKMEKPGRKIRITGKGRCNLTNLHERDEFLAKVRGGREFFAYAYDKFDNQATVDFFRSLRVDLTVERGSRVFPTSGDAWEIADALAKFCKRAGVITELNAQVREIRTLGTKVSGVKITNYRGFERNIEAPNVIVCTGGAAYPGTGSTGDGYKFAHALGHRIEGIRPSLVPLVSDNRFMKDLCGLHLRNVGVTLVADGEMVREEFGDVDFSSRGIEGAAILRISRDAVDAVADGKNVEVVLDLKPALDREVIRDRIRREMEALPPVAKYGEILRKLLPKALVAPVASAAGAELMMQLRNTAEEKIVDTITTLKAFRFHISDYGPYEQAIVTAGGVSTDDVDSETMQSKHTKGLYFAGEVLDIDADTGGYNLQVAFSTGHLAGNLKGE